MNTDNTLSLNENSTLVWAWKIDKEGNVVIYSPFNEEYVALRHEFTEAPTNETVLKYIKQKIVFDN